MNKRLLLASLPLSLLLIAAQPAQAKWVRVAWTSGATNYVDDASITRQENLRKFAQLTDLKEMHERKFISLRTELETDCSSRKIRSLGGKAFSQPMAAGEVVLEIPTSDWVDIPAKSAAEAQMKFVCER